jgi:hypothetical protein
MKPDLYCWLLFLLMIRRAKPTAKASSVGTDKRIEKYIRRYLNGDRALGSLQRLDDS